MEYKSEAKYVRTSPRKLREVLALIKKQPLKQMLVNLEFMDRKAASILLKALKSAITNVENNSSVAVDKLKLTKIAINGGSSFKRWRAVSRGRTHPYKKRTSHIKIILEEVKS